MDSPSLEPGASRSESRIILVTGATGAQGGSVARHLLARGRFGVRALTRNPASEAARALTAAGAEVVQGDLADRASLRAALKGCYGAFGVTNFWEHQERERELGKNLVNALAGSEVEHAVLSTLPYAKKLTSGALPVPHFDIKGEMEEYARSLGLPATYVHVAFYYENFLTVYPPRPGEDGRYHFGFPQGETSLAAVSVEDIGGVVAVIFERPGEYLGKRVGIVGDDRPTAAYALAMTRASGKPVVYDFIPRETFAAFGFPGAEDLANMFEFQRTRVPSRRDDLEESLNLYPGLRSFEAWLGGNRERLLAALGGG